MMNALKCLPRPCACARSFWMRRNASRSLRVSVVRTRTDQQKVCPAREIARVGLFLKSAAGEGPACRSPWSARLPSHGLAWCRSPRGSVPFRARFQGRRGVRHPSGSGPPRASRARGASRVNGRSLPLTDRFPQERRWSRRWGCLELRANGVA